jgi:hypothetical protein
LFSWKADSSAAIDVGLVAVGVGRSAANAESRR